MKNYLQTLKLRNNLLLLGILCALFNAIYTALDNFTVHHLIVAEDKLTAAFAYLIVGGWTGTIAGLFFALKLGKKLIDPDFNGFVINNLEMHKNAFLEGSLASVSTLFIMLGHQIGDPSVIAALSNLTIIYTLFYDVGKGQARLNNLIFPVVITIIGGMMSTFSGSLEITLLGFLFVVIISNGLGAFSEIIQQKGANVSDSVNFFIWRFFWIALTGTFLAFIVSNQRGYLSLLLETIKMGLLNLHWVILTMFFVFFAIGLKLYLKKSHPVSIVLVILALKVIFSYPITFLGNWFQQGVFGELPNNPSVWIIRIIGSIFIVLGVLQLLKTKIIIRHPSPEYSSNLFQDYLDNGLMQQDFSLSEKSRQQLLDSLPKMKYWRLKKVFYSPATICEETANIIANYLKLEKVELPELNIVKHDFSKFTDSKLWIDGKQPDDSEMQRLRRNSIIYFLEDKLSEPKSDILQRFERLKEILVTEESCLFISHGYTIKLFYLYLKTDFKVSQEELVNLSETDKSFGESLQGFDYPSLNIVKI